MPLPPQHGPGGWRGQALPQRHLLLCRHAAQTLQPWPEQHRYSAGRQWRQRRFALQSGQEQVWLGVKPHQCGVPSGPQHVNRRLPPSRIEARKMSHSLARAQRSLLDPAQCPGVRRVRQVAGDEIQKGVRFGGEERAGAAPGAHPLVQEALPLRDWQDRQSQPCRLGGPSHAPRPLHVLGEAESGALRPGSQGGVFTGGESEAAPGIFTSRLPHQAAQRGLEIKQRHGCSRSPGNAARSLARASTLPRSL